MRSWQITAVLLLSVVVSTELHAQPKPGYAPSSTHIYPAGARRGTKVRVLVGAECIPPETRFKLFGKGVSAPALLTQRVDALHEPSLRRKPTTNPITIPLNCFFDIFTLLI